MRPACADTPTPDHVQIGNSDSDAGFQVFFRVPTLCASMGFARLCACPLGDTRTHPTTCVPTVSGHPAQGFRRSFDTSTALAEAYRTPVRNAGPRDARYGTRGTALEYCTTELFLRRRQTRFLCSRRRPLARCGMEAERLLHCFGNFSIVAGYRRFSTNCVIAANSARLAITRRAYSPVNLAESSPPKFTRIQ